MPTPVNNTLENLNIQVAPEVQRVLDVTLVNRAIENLNKRLNTPGQDRLKGEILYGLSMLNGTNSSMIFSEDARHLFEAYKAASEENVEALAHILGLKDHLAVTGIGV